MEEPQPVPQEGPPPEQPEVQAQQQQYPSYLTPRQQRGQPHQKQQQQEQLPEYKPPLPVPAHRYVSGY
jgi:hypothetical protein